MIQELQIDHAPAIQKKGSPWSDLGRQLTDSEWNDLKRAIKANPSIRRRHGEIREDGKVFHGYRRAGVNGECWLKPDSFRKMVLHGRERARKRTKEQSSAVNRRQRERTKANPVLKEAWRLRMKAYNRAWQQKYQYKINARTKLRASRQKQLTHPTSDRLVIASMYELSAELLKTTGIKHSVDHIIPIKAGGWHHQLNLQVIPYLENSIKQGSVFWMSSKYLDFRDVPEFLWPDSLKPKYELFLKIFGRQIKSHAEIR